MWLKDNGCPWSDSPWSDAACLVGASLAGRLDVLAWLKVGNTDSRWRETIDGLRTLMEITASAAGHANVLSWLSENRGRRGPLNENAAFFAALGGHLGVLRWMHENGRPIDDLKVFVAAGSAGRTEVMAWLREVGCPWDASVCAMAARKGRLDALKWLREAGCPWDASVYAAADDKGHRYVAEWLKENGCPTEGGSRAPAREWLSSFYQGLKHALGGGP